MEIYRRIGRVVAERRVSLGLTQGHVAEMLGLSRASLANIETGRQRILVHQLFALVTALKLNSILDLAPETWAPVEPLPKFEVRGSPLSPRQQSGVEGLLASALAKVNPRRRSS